MAEEGDSLGESEDLSRGSNWEGAGVQECQYEGGTNVPVPSRFFGLV